MKDNRYRFQIEFTSETDEDACKVFYALTHCPDKNSVKMICAQLLHNGKWVELTGRNSK
jgi:hypothetical protein